MTLVGFSVALMIVAVSALYAAPMYYKIVHNYQVTKHTNELVATLRYARAQAAVRGRAVSVCSSDNGSRCSNTPWVAGYIVFVDDGVPGVVDADDSVLQRHFQHNPKATITLHGSRYVRFGAMGNLVARYTDSGGSSSEGSITRWLDRLWPVSSAHADSTGLSARDVRRSPLAEVSAGRFTICVRHTGRTIRLSPQGRISTGDAYCS